MQIEIPQYISAYVNHHSSKLSVTVYIGDAPVYTFDANEFNTDDWSHDELKDMAVTAFGKMLALKIGD